MKQIIIVKPGSISKANKKLLTNEGHVIIEHANPQEVRFVSSIEGIQGDEIVQSLIEGIASATIMEPAELHFGKALLRKLKKK